MARTNRKSELVSHISDIGVYTDTAGGGSSTITGALPSVDTLGVQNAVSGTGFANNDFYRLRALDNKPEIGQVASILTNAITPKYRLMRALAVGDPIVEQTRTSLGHVAAGSVRFSLTGQTQNVRSETLRRTFANLIGTLRWNVEFSLLGFNLENFMTTLGMLDTSANILGAQTQADPLRTFVNGEKVREQNDRIWYVNFVLKDGSTCLLDLAGVEVDYGAMKKKLQRGQTTVVPVKLIPTGDVRLAQYL